MKGLDVLDLLVLCSAVAVAAVVEAAVEVVWVVVVVAVVVAVVLALAGLEAVGFLAVDQAVELD